jgi:hypothetical protein
MQGPLHPSLDHSILLSLYNTLPRFLTIPLYLSLFPPLFPLPFSIPLSTTPSLPPTLSISPHPRSFDTFPAASCPAGEASNLAFVVAPPHCALLSWHALHALCNHTGPARDVSRQGGDAHKLSTDGSREIQRPRALCLCPVFLEGCRTFRKLSRPYWPSVPSPSKNCQDK